PGVRALPRGSRSGSRARARGRRWPRRGRRRSPRGRWAPPGRPTGGGGGGARLRPGRGRRTRLGRPSRLGGFRRTPAGMGRELTAVARSPAWLGRISGVGRLARTAVLVSSRTERRDRGRVLQPVPLLLLVPV